LRALRTGKQKLEPLGGERFVIGNEDAERLSLGH
jgi:hypothetical protein